MTADQDARTVDENNMLWLICKKGAAYRTYRKMHAGLM